MNWVLLSLLLTAGEADVRPVDFETQIEPLLTRYGCNAGSCHGAAAGRGGFSLSLYGSVPERDYAAITQQLEGRRVNLSRPADSLLFLKATESTPHGGGPRFDIDSDAAALLQTWIRQGARRTADTEAAKRRLQTLRIEPSQLRMEAKDDSARLRVFATFADDDTRDVTAWSVLTADDASAIDVTPDGRVTAQRPGRHLLTVRYLDRLLPVEVLVPYPVAAHSAADSSPAPSIPSEKPRGQDSFIDREITARLSELRLPVSPPASPAMFLRRAALRLTGRLPTEAMLDELLAACANPPAVPGDGATEQRAGQQSVLPLAARRALIDKLLASPAYEDFWTFQFVRLLKVQGQQPDDPAAQATNRWLRAHLAADRPLDELARELITATGDTRQNGATAFYRAASDARLQAEFASELLLGVRLRCANCHDHPLDQWTQDDYHGLAAIFAPVRRGASITLGSSGSVVHPRTGEPAVPKLPGGRFLREDEDGIAVFADWLTSRDNAWFDRAIVNRVWQLLLGRGLVEPVDDLRASNAPTHPRLLDDLATEFAQGDRRLKPLIRSICLSDTFARSSIPIRGDLLDDQFHAHAIVSELEPEVLLDAVADVTGVPPALPEGASTNRRAVGVLTRNLTSETLDVLGRCPVDAECSSAGSAAAPLPRALLLINGGFLNDRLTASSGTLTQLLTENSDDGDLIRSYYRRALTREPSTQELAFWTARFQSATDARQRREIAEDFLWALLTCQEFVTCR